MNSAFSSLKPNYGLDAPGLVRAFTIGGVVLFMVGMLPKFVAMTSGLRDAIDWMVWPGISFTASGLLMIWSSCSGKFRARDKLISALSLKGSDSVLDLGCGRGLLLLGAAKQLTSGKAIGVDLWSQVDLSSNSKDAILTNAKLEGVLDRVEIIDGDMRKLPLDDQSVDVVIASMSIHNIPTEEGRREAVKEAARVLRPGGRVALLDFKSTGEYESTLRECGLQKVKRSPISFWNFPPSRTVFGEKTK